MWCIKQGVLEINIVINSLFQGSSRRTKFWSGSSFFFSSQLARNESCSLGNVNVCKEAITLSCGGNKGWEFLVYLLSLCQMSKLLHFSTGSSLHVSMIMGGWRFVCPMTRKLSCDLRNGPFAWLKHARIYRCGKKKKKREINKDNPNSFLKIFSMFNPDSSGNVYKKLPVSVVVPFLV